MGSDGGSEFKSHFNNMCDNFGIEYLTTGAWNPQANAILESIHQVLANHLRLFDSDGADLGETHPWDEFLTATVFAIRSIVQHTTLGVSLTQLVFGRDMVLPIQCKADWVLITLKKQKMIERSNHRENSKRFDIEYKLG